MKVLLTGGAGYIGSHTARALKDAGHHVIVIDNLSVNPVNPNEDIPLQKADITDYTQLRKAVEHLTFDAVMHFAAKIEVKESMTSPLEYYQNNVGGLLNVLRLMKEKQCEQIIFSSTAAVYGIPQTTPITENEQLSPINVYGRTKLMCEQMLQDACSAYGWNATVLRYFNACGASTDGTLGQLRNTYSHAIPLMILALLKKEAFFMFGTDYPTKDGTAVRDYIHVLDLAEAHIRALESKGTSGSFRTFNVGTGTGYSVRELVSELERISGLHLNVVEKERRIGDPPELIASNQKIINELGWRPRYSDLTTIMNTAYYWHKKVTGRHQN